MQAEIPQNRAPRILFRDVLQINHVRFEELGTAESRGLDEGQQSEAPQEKRGSRDRFRGVRRLVQKAWEMRGVGGKEDLI